MGLSLKRLIQYAFNEIGLQRVYAQVVIGNVRSNNVLRRAGFRKWKSARENLRVFLFEKSDIHI
ncbi:GNAT family N-acetyltransferase [Patescibacteria group bacterium]